MDDIYCTATLKEILQWLRKLIVPSNAAMHLLLLGNCMVYFQNHEQIKNTNVFIYFSNI